MDKLQSIKELIKEFYSKHKKMALIFTIIVIIVDLVFDKIDFTAFFKFVCKVAMWIYSVLINNVFFIVVGIIIVVICITLYKCKRMNFIGKMVTDYLNSDCGSRNGFKKINIKKNKREVEISIESQSESENKNYENIDNKNIIPYHKPKETKKIQNKS